MKLKRGINKILFACQQTSMSIEWMSEDLIFIVNIAFQTEETSKKPLILFIIDVRKFWGEKRQKIAFI